MFDKIDLAIIGAFIAIVVFAAISIHNYSVAKHKYIVDHHCILVDQMYVKGAKVGHYEYTYACDGHTNYVTFR